MKLRYLLLFVSIVVCFPTMAQHSKVSPESGIAKSRQVMIHPGHSSTIMTEAAGEVSISQDMPKWNQRLVSFAKNHELPEKIRKEKEERTKVKNETLGHYYPDESNAVLSNPKIGVNFRANLFDGYTPPDNSMAVSSNGIIVTVTNSHLEYYNSLGQNISSISFADFFNDPAFTGNIYDPVVLFDSGSDRFFMVVLHSSSSATSRVVACFSKSADPSDGWYYYKLTGNPLNNGCWFDYPKIGVSSNEVYITGNLFSDANVFNQSIIYQITKEGGYNGTTLGWQYWQNISESPFTLVPASYGLQGNYGPGIYFIATKENETSDCYYLYDLTDDMTGSPQLKAYAINASFSLAGDAYQLGTGVLMDNGETRGLSAFYLNGVLHFVHNAEYANNYNGLSYNRLNTNTLSNWSSTFGLDGYDYSYPSVASFGQSADDKSVMIGFLRSGSTIYPQTRVVNCDNDGNWSGSSLIKEGETYVDVYASNNVTRWGDYSGISRKQNTTLPEVWVSGCFGAYESSQHSLDTWVAQITGMSMGQNENVLNNPGTVKVFPNPAYDMINIEFNLEQKSLTEISVVDIQGQLVKLLFRDFAAGGKNMISFNKGALTKGIYFIKIQAGNKNISNEKLVIL
jgi:hypothetical protein